MANYLGIREIYFKDEGPNSVFKFKGTNTLRIYCLKYGNSAVILGGGGIKGSKTLKYQDDIILFNEVRILRKIDKILSSNNVDFTKLENYVDQVFEVEI